MESSPASPPMAVVALRFFGMVGLAGWSVVGLFGLRWVLAQFGVYGGWILAFPLAIVCVPLWYLCTLGSLICWLWALPVVRTRSAFAWAVLPVTFSPPACFAAESRLNCRAAEMVRK